MKHVFYMVAGLFLLLFAGICLMCRNAEFSLLMAIGGLLMVGVGQILANQEKNLRRLSSLAEDIARNHRSGVAPSLNPLDGLFPK
jgi:hypothetical protein